MSLDILILKKQQFSKFQKIDQSYPKVAIKVTNIKDINIKILCFFIHTFPHMFFDPKKTPKKWQFFLFMTIILTLFTLGVTLIGQSKLPQVPLKLLQVRSKLPPFDGVTLITLWFRISSKKLIVTYRKDKELKANYHIALHSVADDGACVMLHIFKTFKKPPKLIKVTPFHGTVKQG